MASSPTKGRPTQPARRVRPDFWDRWSTRVVVIIAAIATVIGIAILGDPEHESWQTKTRDLVHTAVLRHHFVHTR